MNLRPCPSKNAAYSVPVDAVLLLGPTGAGKSPLGEHIARNGFFGKRAHHFDFGAELRALPSRIDPICPYTEEEIAFVTSVLEQGILLENRHFPLARKILCSFLDRSAFIAGDVLILNGLPRHAGQANDMSSVAAIHILFILDCSADSVLCRLRNNVGGDRAGRFDDDVSLVENKLRLFNERTAPLVDHYRKTGTTIVPIEISGHSTTQKAYQKISVPAAGYPPIPFVAEPPQR